MTGIYKSIIVFFITINSVFAENLDTRSVNEFIDYMVVTHDFNASELQTVFSNVKLSNRVLNAIVKPAEKLPWYKYRPIFIQPDRIDQGIQFWEKHYGVLTSAEERFGIPSEIIVAIIGVETRYGKFKGKDNVMDALSTLAFHYPKRSKFFRSELEQFLLLTREQNVNPLSLKGSYAGAMGIPQFISSSYREYAIDFDDDGKIDIWNNTSDAIGSVANYFKKHGWKTGEEVVIRGEIIDGQYFDLENTDSKPDVKANEIIHYGIKPERKIEDEVRLKILSFENENNNEIWLGFNNFYVITRYNNSALYAMAVYQLAEEITSGFKKKIAATN